MPGSVLFDITRPLDGRTLVWPGDEAFRLEWTALRTEGHSANVSAVRLSVHTGTHADAPFHVDDGGARIGEMSLEPFIGRARVVEARGKRIDDALVREIISRATPPQRILFRTGAWASGSFPTAFTAIDSSAIQVLRDAGVVLVGTDAPSVDPYESVDLPSHRALAAAGIVILENLLLDDVPEGDYELVALPLKLREADGSPVRALLRRV